MGMGQKQEQQQEGEIMAVGKLMREQNPMQQIQVKFKEVETKFKSWLSKQSLPVEAGVVSALNGAQGAAIGCIMGTLSGDLPQPQPGLDSQAMPSLQQAQALAGGPLVQARNFAVITGVNAGIACVMKRLRGKEDLESAVVAAMGSGAMFSLVSTGFQNQPVNAISTAAAFALFQGVFYKLGEKFSKPNTEDVYYTQARSMLAKLGLQSYEKNFRRGLLTDTTLPLLTDSALRDVKIPPGPRLLILDHIHRDPEIKGKRGNR